MSDPFQFQELLTALIRKHFAGFSCATIIINPPGGGWPFVLAVPSVCDMQEPLPSEGEQEILDAFQGLPDGKVLSVSDIATRVGCENSSNLRERLGRLVRMKRLVNERPGYRLA